jgi:hypothetical protein
VAETGRRIRWVALGAVIGLATTAGGIGIASATIPAPGGVVKACYKTDGTLRVKDSAATCKAGEKGLQWNQKGPTGPTGAGLAGPTGPSGVATITPLTGYVGPSIAGGMTTFAFVGDTVSLSVTAGQRLTGSASAVVGVTADSVNFDFGICTSTNGGTTLVPMAGSGAFQTATADMTRRPFANASTVVSGYTGDVLVGFCLRNGDTGALDSNDWVNGFVQVTN